MDAPRQSDQFPCPFCHSGSLLVIGGSRRFHYYRCGDCAEIWTVTDTWGHRDASQPANRLPLMH